jgi:hypothetical protein
MRLEFQLPDQVVTVEVDLANNPGAQAWISKFDKHVTLAGIHDHLYVPEINVSNEDVYDHARQQCLTVLDNLKQMGVEYTGPIPFAPDQVNAACLNQLHRFFTHTQQIYNTLQAELSQQNQDPDHCLPSIGKIIQHLQELNHCVHEMEFYCVRAHADVIVDSIEEIKLYTPTEFKNPAWIDLECYREFHTDQHYDVILSSEVLGKTLLQSYIDGDDPTDWDTSGHYSSAGGLQICWTNTRQQIYQSEHFKNWLKSHDAVDVWYDFPIGNIRNLESFQPVLDFLKANQSTQVPVTYHK